MHSLMIKGAPRVKGVVTSGEDSKQLRFELPKRIKGKLWLRQPLTI